MSHTTREIVNWSAPAMGGRLEVAIATDSNRRAAAVEAARRAGQRVNAWADRLTRFTDSSDLTHLNTAATRSVHVRPTLGSALAWARTARERTGGVVDPTLLGARLAAETGADEAALPDVQWQLTHGSRTSVVERAPGVRFDLDGLAKGWLADRAAALLAGWPGAAVDADGDIALSADPGVEWLVEVADPRSTGAPLATLRLTGGATWTRQYGVATSGTSVHRWTLADGSSTHHLIDPRTARPAQTDVVQATVIAPSAREAEVIAKTAVILGSDDALEYLGRSAALTALLMLETDELACLSGVEAWLA